MVSCQNASLLRANSVEGFSAILCLIGQDLGIFLLFPYFFA